MHFDKPGCLHRQYRLNNQLKNNPSKNAGYYLSKLFELSGLDAELNKNIIKSIIKDNSMEELNAIINTLLTKDKLQKNIDENLLALFSENQNNKSLNLLQYTKSRTPRKKALQYHKSLI